MKAITQTRYGGPEVLRFQDIDKPIPQADEVLIEVRAASLNVFDWVNMTGLPYLVRLMGGGFLRPKRTVVGSDVAGIVEAVGSEVTRFQPGDEVMGDISGSFAEYAVAKEKALTDKPAGATFEEAAGIPLAGLTALQALRDHGEVKAGQRVLVNGASGSVGPFAVQIAKAMGADVTAVCSTGNVETAGSIGADRVINYTREDFTQTGDRYDVIVDIAGSRSPKEYRETLVDGGIYVPVGGPKGRLLDPIPGMMRAMVTFLRGSKTMKMFVARVVQEDLDQLKTMAEEGKLRTVIDRRYSLAEVPDAFRYLGEGHARGKLVVTV